MAPTTPTDHTAAELDVTLALPERWKGKDALLIQNLVMGLSYQKAGERSGLSKATVKRRMADPAFRRVVAEQQAEYALNVRRHVTSRTMAALQVLTAIFGDNAPAGGPASRANAKVRVDAAGKVLQAFVQLQPRDPHEDELGRPAVDVVLVGVDVGDLR